MQGSSNFSYLTKRGQAQADTTRILVRQQLFTWGTLGTSAAKTQAVTLDGGDGLALCHRVGSCYMQHAMG